MTPATMAAAVAAAQAHDLANLPPGRNWGRVPDDQVARLLTGASRHLAGLPPQEGDRPVFVVAVGHDLGPDDAAKIQHAVARALREGT